MLHRKTDWNVSIFRLPGANDREMTKSNISIHKDKLWDFTKVTGHCERKTNKLPVWNRKHTTKDPQPWKRTNIDDES